MATFWEIAARSVSNLVSLYFVYLYYLFISRFVFKRGICLLIAPVPVHCFSITSINVQLHSFVRKYKIFINAKSLWRSYLQCKSYNIYTCISKVYLKVWCCYMYLYILLSFEPVGRNSFFHQVSTAVLFRLLAPNFYIVKLGNTIIFLFLRLKIMGAC